MTCDLIIPAVNEAANINALFDVLEPMQGTIFRNVIVSDNGSSDNTAELASSRGAIVVHEALTGYGAACLKAIDWIAHTGSSPDAVAFLDADLADDPSTLPQLLEALQKGKTDFIVGSRVKLAERGALNIPQRFGGWLACTLMWLFTGRRYTDLGPLRAIRWKTLNQLTMTDRTWGWTVEMQMKAAIRSVPTVEVDVPYRQRRYGRSKISGTVRGVFNAGTRIIFTIFHVWWNFRPLATVGSQQSAKISC